VIHAAAVAALAAGATLESTLQLCERVSERVPVVLMTYANMVLAGGGAAAFAERAAAAGAAGAIVPDLPLDEADDVRQALEAAGLASVPMLAPTTPAERRARICEAATGFVYLVSGVGTTGERAQLPPAVGDLAAEARRVAAAPVAVGFGVGSPEQAVAVGRIADGVIIGSRLVRAAAEADTPAAAVTEVSDFLRRTRDALGAAD
jgi:tryptophan synthase alpha chain